MALTSREIHEVAHIAILKKYRKQPLTRLEEYVLAYYYYGGGCHAGCTRSEMDRRPYNYDNPEVEVYS